MTDLLQRSMQGFAIGNTAIDNEMIFNVLSSSSVGLATNYSILNIDNAAL